MINLDAVVARYFSLGRAVTCRCNEMYNLPVLSIAWHFVVHVGTTCMNIVGIHCRRGQTANLILVNLLLSIALQLRNQDWDKLSRQSHYSMSTSLFMKH